MKKVARIGAYAVVVAFLLWMIASWFDIAVFKANSGWNLFIISLQGVI